MTWKIDTYVGVGNILFGMSPAEVERIIGKPETMEQLASGVQREIRQDEKNPILDYDEFGLAEISFWPESKELIFQNIAVFVEDQHVVLEKIIRLDNELLGNFFGTIVSLQFGVSFSGFFYLNDGNKSFGCFRRGYWDNLTIKMSALPSRPNTWPVEEVEED